MPDKQQETITVQANACFFSHGKVTDTITPTVQQRNSQQTGLDSDFIVRVGEDMQGGNASKQARLGHRTNKADPIPCGSPLGGSQVEGRRGRRAARLWKAAWTL